MKVYIDESGNLGEKGRYFIITALIPRNSKRIKNIVMRSFLKFSKEIPKLKIAGELKGSILSFKHKQDFILKLTKKDDFSIAYIVADKKHIIPKLKRDNNLCFNYLARHLFKYIINQSSQEDIDFIIDNRSIKVASKNTLEDYIRIEAYTKWNFENEINFIYLDSRNSKNLQAVDIVSNAIYGRYYHNKKHFYKLIINRLKSIRFPYVKFGQD